MSNKAGIGRRTALTLAAAGALVSGRAKADVALNVWTGYPELVPWYKAMAEAYAKAKPGTTVNVFSTTLREHEQKLSAAVPTGTGPDLFDVGQILSISFIEAGMIKPNPPAIDKQLRGGAYRDASVSQFTTDGKTYGLPMLFSTAAMLWNKAMFKEAGIAGPPEDFDELMAAARKLVKFDAAGKMTRSGVSLRLSGQGSGIAEKFRYVMEPAGASLVVPAKGGKYHQGYDNQAAADTLKFYVDAVQTYKVDDPKVQHDADAFVAGNTAMLFREAWVIGQIQQQNPSLDYGVAPIPAWKKGMPKKALMQHDGLYVNGKSKNQDAAYDFMLFLTNPENSVKLTVMSGWVAARTDVDWSPLLQKTPQFAGFTSPPKDVQFFADPVMGAWNEVESRLADLLPDAYVNPAMQDPANRAAFFKKASAQTDKILKDNDLYGAN